MKLVSNSTVTAEEAVVLLTSEGFVKHLANNIPSISTPDDPHKVLEEFIESYTKVKFTTENGDRIATSVCTDSCYAEQIIRINDSFFSIDMDEDCVLQVTPVELHTISKVDMHGSIAIGTEEDIDRKVRRAIKDARQQESIKKPMLSRLFNWKKTQDSFTDRLIRTLDFCTLLEKETENTYLMSTFDGDIFDLVFITENFPSITLLTIGAMYTQVEEKTIGPTLFATWDEEVSRWNVTTSSKLYGEE